jgi:hypothetical protein
MTRLVTSEAQDRDIATVYLRWAFARALLARGYWLVTSLYLVVEADLSAFQLVFIGTAQGLTALVFEIPTGVLADTVSRKRSIVVAHLLIGSGMLCTGLVTSFPALVLTQMLWGLGWTFTSGAEVAWLTDELDQPERTASVLTASARWEQIGGAAGMAALGALAWAAGLATAIVTSGIAMIGLGALVAVGFPERRFTPVRERRWRASRSLFASGVALARRDRTILAVFAATILVNGASEGFGRLLAKHLVALGLPASFAPIVWLTALGLVALALAAIALRIVEGRIDGAGVAPRAYALACLLGTIGLGILALAPNAPTAMAGVLLVQGVARTVTRCVGVVWVNRRVPSEVRATVQSFLAQMEYLGEITLGIGLGILAQATAIPAAMAAAALLFAAAGGVAARSSRARP